MLSFAEESTTGEEAYDFNAVSKDRIGHTAKSKHPQYKHPQYKHPQYKHPQYKHPQYKHPQYKHPQYKHPQDTNIHNTL
jgi:hypothetical protein